MRQYWLIAIVALTVLTSVVCGGFADGQSAPMPQEEAARFTRDFTRTAGAAGESILHSLGTAATFEREPQKNYGADRFALPDFEILRQSRSAEPVTPENIPPYSGKPYVVLNRNQPYFTAEEITAEAFERYSKLDDLGRCGEAFANVGAELMPTENRKYDPEFRRIKPSGFHVVRYDDIIDDRYLYNRCHLIGYQLCGQTTNPQNLITGTRYFNVKGMLPFENWIARHVKRHGVHVLYRVTPIFKGDELVARGVLMEARSVENNGRLHFCVFVYNVQPGIVIDYATGMSWRAD